MSSALSKVSPIEIAATFGDPASIGPEVGVKAIQKFLRSKPRAEIHIFAPRSAVPQALQNKVEIHDGERSHSRLFTPGNPSKKSGARALRDLDRAIEFCLSKKNCSLVTGPIDKFFCSKTLPGFSGHTDYLRLKTRSKGITMVLSGPSLTVGLVTTHIPLKEVPGKISKNKIIQTALRLNDHLKRTKKKPRLAILGLNPHASDRGLMGSEEKTLIRPAVSLLRKWGVLAEGPFSSDSFFRDTQKFDAVIAMYHDQGLIPLKMLHFFDAVNITLGLPFLRVSVDHGTAFGLAGKNQASYLSYLNALQTAYDFVVE